MSPFFETIRVEDGKAWNLSRHEERMNRTRQKCFGEENPLSLASRIGELPREGLYRCRVIYDREIRSVEILPYTPRIIRSFLLLRSSIEYPYKSCDRSEIDRLFAQRNGADEILILSPEGRLRDTSIANVALKLEGIWWTPSDPLLPGAMREKLLTEGRVRERDLKVTDLERLEAFAVMNAMVGFREVPTPRFLFG